MNYLALLPLMASMAFTSCGDETGSAPTAGKAPISSLPSDAKNISHSLPVFGPNYTYEFDTSEKEFREWVANQKKPAMGPIRRERAEIVRYNAAIKSEELVYNSDGLISEWTGARADIGQHMVYDLQKGRAYFWYHSR